MPVRDDPRLAALLLHFTRLPAAAQTLFLERLNLYLFASPGRRRQLRRQWCLHARVDDPGNDA